MPPRTTQRSFAVLAGFAWGLAAFARPYDALLGGVAIIVAVAARRPRRTIELVRLGVWAGFGAVAPLVAVFAFNQAMTGDAMQLPFNLLESSDRPGFGLRRALPNDAPLDYTPTRALSALGRNLLLVTAWTGGGLLACGLAIATLVRRRLRGGAFVAAVLVLWPLGYVFFWGSYMTAYVWDGALFLGPYYYLPMVAMLAIAAAVGLMDLWHWRPALGGATAVLMLVLSLGVAVPALGRPARPHVATRRGRRRDRGVGTCTGAAVRTAAVRAVFAEPVLVPAEPRGARRRFRLRARSG